MKNVINPLLKFQNRRRIGSKPNGHGWILKLLGKKLIQNLLFLCLVHGSNIARDTLEKKGVGA